ncbi:MAG: nucleotidyltransferase family protein [Paracoccaceae bacterium]
MSSEAPVVAILIAAAGASSRMGRDKLMLKVAGRPMLAHVAAEACATGRPVIAVIPPDRPERRAILTGLPLTIVEAADARKGLSASIRAGLAALPGDCVAVLVVLADMPAIDRADMVALVDAFLADAGAPILRGATATGRPGHPVLLPRRLFSELSSLSGDAGAREVLARNAASLRLVPLPGNRATTDIDTPEDWQDWQDREAEVNR